MNAVLHNPRPTRRWLTALVVLAGTAAAGRAAPQPPTAAPPMPTPPLPPMGEPANKPAEKKVRFEFRDKRWGDVLEWLSEQTGLPVMAVNKPTGTFTFVAPKVNGVTREYTIPEVIDI